MDIEEIKQKMIPIAKEYGVTKLALFGSVAKGETTKESDIDILIEKGDFIRGVIFFKFCRVLEEALGHRVDVITYTGLENSFFRESILASEVVLYERA